MKQLLLAQMLLALALMPFVGTATEAANQPNILLIAVDDMGYSDRGFTAGRLSFSHIRPARSTPNKMSVCLTAN